MVDTDTSPEEQQQAKEHAEQRVRRPLRSLFLQHVISQVGSLYRWGGKGEPGGYAPGHRLFDCSGLVTWAYHAAGGPDWRPTHNTDRLLEECREVQILYAVSGDLVFYGVPSHGRASASGVPVPDPSHVMVLVGAGVVVGACGGDSSTTTLAAAVARGAKVQARPSVDYRKDILGVWRLPFAGE